MFNLISKMSNVEQLSSLIKPYSDRVKKLGQLAHVIDQFLTVILSDDDGTLKMTTDEWLSFREPFDYMIEHTGPDVMFTDPDTGYTTVISVIMDSSNPMECYSCYVNPMTGEYLPREYPFLTVFNRHDDEQNEDYYEAVYEAGNLRDCRSQEDNLVDITKYASELQDQINSYGLSLDAVKLTIKNKNMNAGDYVSHVKTMYTGLRNGSLDLFQNLTTALSTHDVSSIVGVLRGYMDPSGITVNNDGSVNFPETMATKELNFGAVIASGLSSLVSMLGVIVATIAKPLGIAMYGLGMVASSITKGIANAINDSIKVAISDNSENPDIAIKLVQQSYTYADDRLLRNIIANTIESSDFQPHKYELPGLSGYIWPVNYDGTTYSKGHATMAHECYPCCRGYFNHKDLYDLCNTYFILSRESYSYSAGYGQAVVRVTPHPNLLLETFLGEYYNKLIPVDFDEMATFDTDTQNLIYQKMILTDCAISLLMYALFRKLDGNSYTDVTVPINNNHPYPGSVAIPYDMLCVGVQVLCDPFHSDWYNYPIDNWDADYQDWNQDSYARDTFVQWNEVPSMQVAQAMDNYGVNSEFTRLILEAVQYVSAYCMELRNPSTLQMEDCSFQFYPVEQRFDFRLRPPKWTRRSLIFSAILTGVVIAAVATITVIATVKLNKWRKTKQLEMQTKTEAAWDKCKANPSPENLQAYKKAAMKQNTIGKIYGCSTVSKTNYWATPEQPSTNPGDVSNEIVNLIPTTESNTDRIVKLIVGEPDINQQR